MAAACLTLAVGLVGCGSTNPEIDNSSGAMKALCSAYTTLPENGSVRSSIRAWDEQLAELTPPDGMPELARTGMRLQSEVPARATPVPGNRDEAAALDEFHAYATKHCGSSPFSLTAE